MNTKRFSPSILLAGSVAALAVGLATQTFAQSETLISSTVVRMKGHARYSTDGGKTWQMVTTGDRLVSGSMIQTAFKSDMDIVLGGNTETQIANLVSLSEDTLLKLEKVARKQAVGSPETAEEFSLDLRKGTIAGNVGKLSPASRYEITFVNGVAGTREGSYRLRANGELSVWQGKGFIALADGRPAKEVVAGQQFTPATGSVATLPPQATQLPAESQPASAAAKEIPAAPGPPARQPVTPTRKAQPPSTGLRRAAP